MTKYLRISSYIRKPFLKHDFATAPMIWSFYKRNFFFFISVPYGLRNPYRNLKSENFQAYA
jgi:hypothetical protein